jgi:hypothetical protein
MFGDRVTIALEAAYAPRNMRARDINHHINSIHGRFAMIYKLLEKQNENSEKKIYLSFCNILYKNGELRRRRHHQKFRFSISLH